MGSAGRKGYVPGANRAGGDRGKIVGINTINPSPLGNALAGARPQYLQGTNVDSLANKLDMSADQLRDTLQSGRTLSEIAKARGISMQDLRATLAAVVQSASTRPTHDPAVGRLVNFDA
jgi:hypothetical protein